MPGRPIARCAYQLSAFVAVRVAGRGRATETQKKRPFGAGAEGGRISGKPERPAPGQIAARAILSL